MIIIEWISVCVYFYFIFVIAVVYAENWHLYSVFEYFDEFASGQSPYTRKKKKSIRAFRNKDGTRSKWAGVLKTELDWNE